MTRSDRIFGLVVTLGALAYVAGALGIQTSFISDPLGPRAFPMLVGAGAALSGLAIMLRPDAEPDWPPVREFTRIGVATAVLVGYALALQPWGYLVPTAIAAAILSWMIDPRPVRALLTGIGLSVGLYLVFRHALGLGLQPFPRGLF